MGSEAYQVGSAYSFSDELLKPSRYKALYGGRGSAKSHFFGEAIVANAAVNMGFRAVCIREVQKSLKESAKRLIEDKIIAMGLFDRFDIQRDLIKTPGDGVIIFEGMNQHNSESIKSLEGFNVAWAEEASTLSETSLRMLRPTIRAPGSELWFSWNPRYAADPVDKFFRGVSPPEDAIIRRVNYDDNVFFPEELEKERLHDLQHSPDIYGHVWQGDYMPQAIGAIWNMATIHETRRHEAPTLNRILVSVDPAVSNEDHSDQHGIIVGGAGEDDHGYVLEDASMKGSPKQWAERAIAMFDLYEADAIVVERNQGGDMVKHTLKTVRPSIPVVEVVATRGKHVRAEPISALYATNKIHHVGTHEDLEAQMCRMTASGYDGDGSPDRVDAMVWLFTELFPKLVSKTVPRTRPPRRQGWMG